MKEKLLGKFILIKKKKNKKHLDSVSVMKTKVQKPIRVIHLERKALNNL